MMQEVACDETNGESTFEFVERKLEDLNVSDDTMTTNSMQPQTTSDDSQITTELTMPETYVAQPSLPAPTALPQFENFPVDYTTTTRSVPTPLTSTIPPNPTTIQYHPSAPITPTMVQMPQPNKSESVRTNPYSLAAQRKRASYPNIGQNIEMPTPLPMQPPVEGYPGVVQSQPTAFYGGGGQVGPHNPPTPSTAINFGSYDMGLPPQQQTMPGYPRDDSDSGIFHWVREMSRSNIISKFAETAKSSVDSMITTLDPQMKEYIHSGGDVNLYVASNDEESVSAIREAFQTIFGRATVRGISSQNLLAPQLLGFSAGAKASDERIQHLRKSLVVDQHQPLVAIDHFVTELTPDKWFDLACLVLDDPSRGIHINTFSQPTPVPNQVIQMMQEETPTDYPLRWAGLSVTVGNVMSRMHRVSDSDWHEMMCGVAKRQIILLASKTLATQYKMEFLNKS